MNLFDELLSKITKTTKTAVKKSNELMEVAKTNIAIRETQDEINLILNEIGRELYKAYKEGSVFTDELDSKFEKIDEFEKKISDLKEKLAILKKVKICTNCDAENDELALFCSKCGKNIE